MTRPDSGWDELGEVDEATDACDECADALRTSAHRELLVAEHVQLAQARALLALAAVIDVAARRIASAITDEEVGT